MQNDLYQSQHFKLVVCVILATIISNILITHKIVLQMENEMKNVFLCKGEAFVLKVKCINARPLSCSIKCKQTRSLYTRSSAVSC